MIISEKVLVNNDIVYMAEAQRIAERFAGTVGLNRHAMLQLDLLLEETIGMVKLMVDEFYGQVWFVNEAPNCEIHFQATASVSREARNELLSVSTTGKNAANTGFMRRIGSLIADAVYRVGAVMDAYGKETMQYGIVHTEHIGPMDADGMVPIWTLKNYRKDLEAEKASDETAEQAWDELEKSIVGRLADDVIVGIKGNQIEMVIIKHFPD